MDDAARKVLGETWELVVNVDTRVAFPGKEVGEHGSWPEAVVLDTYPDHRGYVWCSRDNARARIAACAPEALRLLEELEHPIKTSGGYMCAACTAIRSWAGDDHHDNCKLFALLKKAGLR